MSTTASLGADFLADPAAAQAAFEKQRQRALWRRRLLPALGVIALLLVWAALVYVFNVPPFIAPRRSLSPGRSIPSSAC